MIHEFYIKIEYGRINRRLKIEDGNYLVKFYSRKTRSHNQNSYYWLCMELIMDGLIEVGYNEFTSKEQVHEFMKHRFLRVPIVNKETGELMGEFTRSTAELTKDEMSNYLTQIDQFCIEYLGFSLPQPNQQLSL